ncbi:37S ribosomal protein S24, mitochondrial [Malassezia sp. CBS 17886]|nr:37S ribosomal protein S24, mitochondrial [Malassezia sp. CBS 17886]
MRASGVRALHGTPAPCAKPRRQRARDNPFALNAMKHFQYDDVPTYGHAKLQKQRQLLGYYRLLQNELPQLEQLREPYSPPAPSSFLRVQFSHYQGEALPGVRKVALSFRVRDLFGAGVLATPFAKHKFLLLAAARWAPPSPDLLQRLNAALAKSDPAALDALYEAEDLGSVKIACEEMPHESQNLKWCSDVLDRMIEEANTEPSFCDVPLDPRPHMQPGGRSARFARVTKKDFPAEWL